MTKVQEHLNRVVATQGVLYTRLHQFHWYVKGPHFFTLHERWEHMYDDVTADMDVAAERLIQLNGEPYSTLQEYLDNSVVQENPEDKNLSERDMVQATVNDVKAYRDLVQEGIELTDEEGDFVTNDIFVELKSRIDKTLWMLQALLGKKPLDE